MKKQIDRQTWGVLTHCDLVGDNVSRCDKIISQEEAFGVLYWKCPKHGFLEKIRKT